MKVEDVRKIMCEYNLRMIKLIKQKYMSNLESVRKDIDKRIVSEAKKGKDFLWLDNDVLYKILEDNGLSDYQIQKLGLPNIRTAICYFYKNDGFEADPSTYLSVHWQLNTDTMLDDVAQVFDSDSNNTASNKLLDALSYLANDSQLPAMKPSVRDNVTNTDALNDADANNNFGFDLEDDPNNEEKSVDPELPPLIEPAPEKSEK